MRTFLKYIFIFLSPFLLASCATKPEITPQQPTLQVTGELENFNENWPPKDTASKSISLSDVAVNKVYADAEEKSLLSTLPTSGNSALSGSVGIRVDDTKFVAGSNANVYLFPDTPYFKRWIKENDKSYAGVDDSLFEYIKYTKTDDLGNYSFKNIPQGKYYVVGVVTCTSECGFRDSKNIRMIDSVYVNSANSKKDIIESL